MLTIQKIGSFSQTHELFSILSDVNGKRQQTWIVSDLKTKQDAQDYMIERSGYCLDDAVLRISEFWRTWVLRLSPKIQFVNQTFIDSTVENFLMQKKESLNLTPEEIKTSLSYLWQMAPFLINQEHQEIVAEWMKTRSEPTKWQKWFLVNKLSMNFLIQELKVLHTSWSSFYLSTLQIEKIHWEKDIVFDLGTEITAVEFGIIQQLSKKINITVLEPAAEFTQRFPTLLRPYEIYRGYAQKIFSPQTTALTAINNKFYRFHNALAEIKWITYQVRQWLNQGIEPQSIMLSSPQLEIYWPILRMHLHYEGIPTDKSHTTKFKDLKIFQILFSRLHFFTDNQNWHNMELAAVYDSHANEKIQKKFSFFRKTFFEMTEYEEIGLDDAIWSSWKDKKISTENMDRNTFLKRVIYEYLSIQTDTDHTTDMNSLFASTVKDFLAKTVSATFKFKNWLNIYIEVVEKLDFKLENQVVAGVKIRSQNLSFVSSVTHKINFGCDQKSLTQSKKRLLPIEDLKSLKQNFEFSINESDENNFEFYLHQSLKHDFMEQVTTLAKTNLTGEVNETPALVLEHKLYPDVSFDVRCLFDDDQHDQSHVARDDDVIKMNFLRTENRAIPQFKKSSYSASSLTSFAKCPFMFYVQSGLSFRDVDFVSVDVGPQQRGQIFHALFDFLNKKNFQIDLELEDFLNDCRLKYQLFLKSDILWNSFKKKLQKAAALFCELEISRGCLQFTRYSEVAFEFNWRGTEVINGRIDRLDVNPQSGEAVVYDYKSSKASISTAKNWLKKSEYQFFVYIMALEDDEQKKLFNITTVKDARYYVFKDFSIKEGFKSDDERDQLLSEFKAHLVGLFERINTKKFDAKPAELKHCDTCNWNETCRAHHLN